MTPEVHPEDAGLEPADFLCPDALDSGMVTEQMDLEQSSVLRGAANFRKANERAKLKGLEDQTGYGATIITRKVQAVAEGIEKFLADADTGKPGKRPVSAKHLKALDPMTAAFIALQVVVGHLQTGRPLTYVALEIGQRIEDEIRMASIRENERRLYTKIVEAVGRYTPARSHLAPRA